jgi:hypothetical protein
VCHAPSFPAVVGQLQAEPALTELHHSRRPGASADNRQERSEAKFDQRLPPSFCTDYRAVTPDGAGHWNTVLAKSCRLWLTAVVMDATDLAAIQAPLSVIAGDKGLCLTGRNSRDLSGLRSARLLIVPGAGHRTVLGECGAD